MATRYVSRLEKLGAPRWMRGLCVVVLALILVGNLAFITLSWAPHGGTQIVAVLACLWILALVALVFLLRLWRATVSPHS
jgi:membrane protein YdbS with pleckstrin-like domain